MKFLSIFLLIPELVFGGWFWSDDMPIVRKIEQNGKTRYLPHLKRDWSGRITEAYGRIPLHDNSCNPEKRSYIAKELRDLVMGSADVSNGKIVDDIGHIIPFSLCGADHSENLFPQNREANRMMGRLQEAVMARGRREEAFDYIDFHFYFEYDDNEKRPSRIRQRHEWGFRNGNHERIDCVLENPTLAKQDSSRLLTFVETTSNTAQQEISQAINQETYQSTGQGWFLWILSIAFSWFWWLADHFILSTMLIVGKDEYLKRNERYRPDREARCWLMGLLAGFWMLSGLWLIGWVFMGYKVWLLLAILGDSWSMRERLMNDFGYFKSSPDVGKMTAIGGGLLALNFLGNWIPWFIDLPIRLACYALLIMYSVTIITYVNGVEVGRKTFTWSQYKSPF